ncbi:phage tail protein [Providencia huaxiensis]|uniref:phage tail-collar fiber domain-containing protein n=1 Tax=Providencia huaxiensis TaxID=2027290 RepID=UPI001B36ED5D|nr:phage tail protein [Providencia huaxiensis]MBQ0534843.1 phage tail protein [Providencia huaxiensis]MBQ0587533.1 phage tail protein [Providencia huaxiensis]
MKYFALLTKLGENLLAQATALGTKLELTHMAVGDGGGSLPTPDTNQTKLIKEQRRAAINTLFIDEQNKNQIIAEQIIPEKDGGWWIREIGLFDKDGNLIAVANCPETYKPQLVEGSGRTQSIRMVLIVSHTESVTLKIDPSVVLATRDYVDDSVKKGIEEHEKSRKHPDATTTDKGFVQLADTLSADNTKAVTPKLATEINQRATNAQTTANTANTSATNANNNANNRVPSTRKVNNKPLSADINLTASDVGAYGKDESDTRFQPKGNYAPAGNYQPAGDYATNIALNNGLGLKLDKTGGTVGRLTVTQSGDAIHIKPSTNGGNSYYQIDEFDGTRAAFIGFGGNSEDKTFTIRNDKDGTNLRINSGNAYVNGVRALVAGDYGLGSTAVSIPDGTDLLEFFKTAPTGFYRTGGNVTNKPHPSVGYADYLCIKHATQLKVICYSNTNITYEIYYEGTKWIGWSTNYSATNTVVDRNGCIKALGAVEYSDYLVGSPIPWPQSTAPTGYLICNGQSFNKTMWPLLAIAYPSGVLPDLRGEFIRGLDAGRNVDSGRVVLSAQGDAIRDITGEIQGMNLNGAGVFSKRTVVATSMSPNGSGKDQYKSNFKASNVVPTASENRPRNIAFLYIVRAA